MDDFSNFDFQDILNGMFLDGVEDMLIGPDKDKNKDLRFIFRIGRHIGRADVIRKITNVNMDFANAADEIKRDAEELIRWKRNNGKEK